MGIRNSMNTFLNKVENGRYALDRIRQKLHLDDDPVYRKQY